MRVYSTIVLIRKEKFSTKAHEKIQEYAEIENTKIRDIYQTAYKFYYNDHFTEKLDIEYKGTIHFKSYKIKTDIVCVTNERLCLNSLHFHFYYYNGDKEKKNSCNKFSNSQIDDHVLFIKNFYNFISESKKSDEHFEKESWLLQLKKILHQKRKRKYTFNLSTYHYSSICLPNKKSLEWEKYALTIWKLLYLHIEGVDEEAISKKLKQRMWSSGLFYRNFTQPGAIVSISIPFPEEDYHADPDWFLPKNGDDYITNLDYKNNYDLLPEYPPLRYLGVLTLEFAGLNEEILRFSYEKLLRIQDQFFLYKFWNSLVQVDKIDNLNNRVFSLEYIKPPIVRDFVTKCIDSKFQDLVQSNLSRLKGNLLNYIVLIFTIIATLLAVTSNAKIRDFIVSMKDFIFNLKM
ncbi:MAG: hypothetical protein GY790_03140 [Bacteroidetes bacterium]|nr:hypothetical protein [Bacteroidota bacterium]